MTHIPYKGIAPGLVDMLAGRVQVTFASAVSTLPHIKSGRLRALAVTSARRVALLPAVATLDESGLTGFEVTQWFGVFAPSRTPVARVARLHREIAAVLLEKEQAQRMSNEGSQVVASAPADFAREMRAEYPRWEAVIRQAGIKAD